MIGETVVLVRAGQPDAYGNPGADGARVSVDGVLVADAGSRETRAGGRDTTAADLALYFPPGSDVRASDRVEVRGQACELVGRPFDWRNPVTGHSRGVVARVNYTEG